VSGRCGVVLNPDSSVFSLPSVVEPKCTSKQVRMCARETPACALGTCALARCRSVIDKPGNAVIVCFLYAEVFGLSTTGCRLRAAALGRMPKAV
jgi:hypothetical protein